jgi:predicted enzyme related to lactoylglutathione lyase
MTTEVSSRRPPGTPCWASLVAHRADLARDFYGTLFGWEFTPGPPQLGSYFFARVGGLRVAGIGEGAAGPHRPVSWTTMLAVDDADHAAESVRECGGTVGIGPLNVGDDGRLAVAVDPSGAVFGIWQSGVFGGAEVTGVPGSVARSELVTNDTTLVGKFYEAVFGFALVPAGAGGEDRAVFTVDGHAATRLAARLGGSVLTAPHPAPHGIAATVADPEGAAFSLLARP